jgi:hypothetical protein
MIEFDNTLGQIFQKQFWKILKEKRLNTRTAVLIQGKRDRSGNLDSASTRVIPQWGKFFSKLKNCEEELVRDSGS